MAFLHFRIDKQDFDKVVATRKCMLTGTYSPSSADEPTTMPSAKQRSWGLAPDWWRPEDLHEPTLYETKLDPVPTGHTMIWVNAEHTEVYFGIINF